MNFKSAVSTTSSHRCLPAMIATLLLLIFSLASNLLAAEDKDSDVLQQALDAFLTDLVNRPGSPLRSAVLRLEAPGQSFVYEGAAGFLRNNNDQAIRAQDRFYIASISKTLTAVRALQMVEEGRFTLDTTLGELKIFDDSVVQALYLIDGKSYGALITIRQLLGHRSGMRDYLLDDRSGVSHDFESGLAPGSMAAICLSQWPEFLACSGSNPVCDAHKVSALCPARSWIPWNAEAFADNPGNRDSGLLNFYLSEMADTALSKPGADSHYSDTNFMLMGVIMQLVAGTSLQNQFKKGIFGPAEMNNSYLSYAAYSVEARDTSRLSDFLIGDTALPSSGIDISWDWGGGGVVSTARDLSLFMQALIGGDLFEQAQTLEQMLNFLPVRIEDDEMMVGYGLGIRYASTAHGPRWGHSGAWGAKMEYFPDLNLYLSGTVNAYGTNEAETLLNEAVRLYVQHQAGEHDKLRKVELSNEY